ncbi:hypothetical protein L917_21139 [Phytophthora nicotianae]|uniref:Cilia- and flagella-associated protein 157 n=3 Tax=Phytophthora nicotianae TaxID=4792 RepID=W2PHI2_PHYN3|nr:hypothetical protein PPTG_18726 [Phytophthora nicotianae INRA-310]ETI30933.1 hypothetical protein F443_22014 [Phytophthora nicotianae P1569]ETL77981.1 hypothetical protein L917_21139 [Phytophthora nicotianae]ETM99469.1 hypothetical protein PPTG_18726 [Phytophthora nicotianae INRA-310]
MSAGAPTGNGSLLSATDFFGKTDVGGLDKFKTIAFRALHEQKLEEELYQTKQENERLKEANAQVTRALEELQISFEANIDDRERVLAFKSKKIDELHNRVREYETINASLLQTINGSGSAEGDTSISQSNTNTTTNSSAESTGTETETRARMMTLINAGKPLFHPLDTCKEQEYKQLYEESQRQCAELTQTALENEAAIRETRLAKFNKQDSDTQIEQLQSQLAAMALEKDELEHHLERKLILENDRLRREKEAELQAFHDAMRTQMRMQLDVTTQRTVEENERVQLELRYQSSQLEKMIKQIDELRAENKRTKQEMHVFEEMNAGLSKKLKFYEQLFAKMQLKDEQKSKQVDNQQPRTPVGPPSSRRTPRKPPLPVLSTVNQAKPTSPEPALYCMGSPHGSYFTPESESLRTSRYTEFEPGPNDPQTPYQLNAITDVLEKHLQSREFTKKQVVAVLRYHHDQYQRRESPRAVRDVARVGTIPVLKKKLMLSKACYLPSSYGRRIREPSMTLDTLIKQKISSHHSSADSNDSSDRTIDDEQRQTLHNLLLPELSKQKRTGKSASSSVVKDPSEMWRSSASRARDRLELHDPPSTARF